MDTIPKINDRIREMRKEFFAFRNGIVADKLRKAGDPHPIIMGCLLVDIQAIAKRQCEAINNDDAARAALAQELWNDTNSRECRLAAPMLYPPGLMQLHQAMEWCQSVETVEVADTLCHKLLRHIQDSDKLFRRLISHEQPLIKYTGYRLLLNLIVLGKMELTVQLKAAIECEAANATPPLAQLLQNILE